MTHPSYTLLRERRIDEIASTARLYRHEKTGAEVLSLENDDENKVFGVTFVTPPPDSTGLPHIMEHSVLGGSRKYPVKEPFVELVKGSLATFVNAMTGPDRTMYPVASQNEQDLRHLIDVYLDAVFHPRITRHTLLQEGWHYEPDEEDPTRLKLNGIVLNEMKGAYSSPDMLLYRRSLHSLFPDTPIGNDSGGDPAVIPDLTYERFRAFHEAHYHAGNARIWWSGDDDPAERLALLDAALGELETGPGRASIPLQPRFEEPRSLEIPYDARDDDAKCWTATSWLLGEVRDPAAALADDVLDHVLVGTPASPLRKALIDSGLGEDLTMGGLNDGLRESYFSIGLKGVARDDLPRVETLVVETLEGLARDGIDPATVEASLNTVEFRLRENNTGRYPRGLSMMMRALPTWVHGGDPTDALAFADPLATLRSRLEAGERVFEDRIREGILENGHRTTVSLIPDPKVRQRLEDAERERLEAAAAAMDEAERTRVAEEAAELRRLQDTPDSAEALATIPTLSLEDLDRKGRTTPTEDRVVGRTETLLHELPTGGIAYLDLGLDLHTLPPELLPYAPVLGRALLETGTAAEDHVRLTQHIGRSTGGIAPTTFTTSVVGQTEAASRLFLRGKALTERTGDLVEVLGDVLLTPRLDDRDRIRQIVLESRARVETQLIPMGHAIASGRLAASQSEAGWASDRIGGVEQLFFLRRLAEEVESDWDGVRARLEAVRATLVDRSSLLVNVTVDAESSAAVEARLAELLDRLPAGETARKAWTVGDGPAFEALTLPARGNYVAKGADLRALAGEPSGAIAVVTKTLNTTYLWDRVRVRGGAYSSRCGYDRTSGLFSFSSYRDPNLLDTVSVFDGAGRYLKELELDAPELVRSVIGTIGNIDAPRLPDGKGWEAMARRLAGVTDEDRQRRREQVLDATLEDFRRVGEALERVAEEGRIVVLGSPEAVEEARASRPEIEVRELL
jgi:Zn-dependent M16 (insulinase) family peptidase